MQGRQRGGDGTGVGKDRFFVSLLLLDLFCLWCKKLLWRLPTLADVHIQEVLVARAGRCFVPEKVRAGLGCRCPVASSDEIFFSYFFFVFFFFVFSILLKYLQQ